MRVTASGDVLSIRFGCLGVLVYPKQPDPGYGEAVCQSVGGSISFSSASNGVLTFIPGVYQQFQPASESDATLTIMCDDRP